MKKEKAWQQWRGQERLAWQTEKDRLVLLGDNGNYSIGYETHSVEDYAELVPTFLDVMEALLQACTVFAWFKTQVPQMGAMAKRQLPAQPVENFAWAVSQLPPKAGRTIFYNGDSSVLVQTHGVDREILEKFYHIEHCATRFQHAVYGFFKAPLFDPETDYAAAYCKIRHVADYRLVYQDCHVELSIESNPETVDEREMLAVIQQICAKHNKRIINQTI